MQGKFSVVIPTLQRSELLPQVVNLCDSHPLVGEVIIINNEQKPLEFDSPTVRVVNLEQNIFVNPAWNMGVSLARHDLIALVNDDVLFDPCSFDLAESALNQNFFGIIGPDKTCFFNPIGSPRIRIARFSPASSMFGTFMCMRRENYEKIPDDIKIWGGDDFLILSQAKPPGVLVGVKFETEMSTTSGSEEFQALRLEEYEAAHRVLSTVMGKRWWHKPFEIYNLKIRPHQDSIINLIKNFKNKI